MDPSATPPPEVAALLEQLRQTTDPLERQRLWDEIVAYQRRAEVRAQPESTEPAP